MDKLLLSIFLCLFVTAIGAALPLYDKGGFREKRDVMETMKDAKDSVVKTLGDAGDSVVNVFKPTEKSVVDKIADEIKSVGN